MTYSFRTTGNYIDFVHTDSTSLQVETVLKSLHNTSRCVDWSLPEDTTRITFTIDEVEFKNILITEIDFDGTAMTVQADFETGIVAMFSGYAGGSPGGSSYLVYTATLLQDSTNPPVASVLENTLGGTLVWSYGSVGYYIGTLANAFPDTNKIVFLVGNGGNRMFIANGSISTDTVYIETYDEGGVSGDGLLQYTSIEIRVYP